MPSGERAFSLSYHFGMLPPWSVELRRLYWFLRAARHFAHPSRRTWWRRIADEKKRLLGAGVDPFELHAVCVLLGRSEFSPAARRAAKVLKRPE